MVTVTLRFNVEKLKNLGRTADEMLEPIRESDRMECLLPDGEMTGVKGFTREEVRYHHGKMIQMQDNILEWSKEDAEERRDEDE